MTDREESLEQLRPGSLAIANRMLGTVAEAEDVVGLEALLRVHRALEDGERLESPRELSATVTTRLAIDELRSVRARRERYVGEWLPEPILTDGDDDPETACRDRRLAVDGDTRAAREPLARPARAMVVAPRRRHDVAVGGTSL